MARVARAEARRVAVQPRTPPALLRAALAATHHLDGLQRRRVTPSSDASTLRARLGKPLTKRGIAPPDVIDELIADVEGGIMGSASGRFFGWVIGGSLESALAADWLASAWDQNAALFACGPAAAIVEEVVGSWTKELLGLPISASFALTTGCQLAHVTCLAAARHALLAARGWDVERRGLAGSPAIAVLVTARAHGSVERAVRLLGLGTDSLVEIAEDARGRMDAASLARAVSDRSGQPTVVLLQAGDINTGTFDAFDEMIPIAHAAGAWVHVDGAFGLWARCAPMRSDLAAGVDQADSWATDAHKWLNVPYDCGLALVRDVIAHRSAMSHRASYLTHDDDARDQIDWGPDWSRRARGFAVYAALRELGREGVADLVERCCAHAERMVRSLAALPGCEILWAPTLNQALVRFPDPSPSATPADHDRHTEAIIARVVASGEAYFGATTWRGMRAMRISACNWRTDEQDVDRAVLVIRAALHGRATS